MHHLSGAIAYSDFPHPSPHPGGGELFKSRFSRANAREKRLKLFFPFLPGIVRAVGSFG